MSKILIAGKKNLEKGLYEDARKHGRTLTQHLQVMADNGEIAEDLYDPDARDAKGQPVDAFRQLMLGVGLRTRGAYGAQTVNEVFLTDNQNRVLFPEYINREYRDQERLPRNELTLADLVLTRNPITASVYQYGVIKDDRDNEPARVTEAADLPLYTVKFAQNPVYIRKYGGRMHVSYETLKRSSLDVLGRWVARVRRRAERAQVKDALEILVNGDGNSNAAPSLPDLAGTTYTIDDIIDLVILAETNDADPSILTGDLVELGNLLKMDFVKDAASTALGADFRDTGMWPRILGMQPKRAPSGSVLEGAKKIVAIDQLLGLEMAFDPEMELTESAALIEKQVEVITFSEAHGFGKPDKGAAVTVKHA